MNLKQLTEIFAKHPLCKAFSCQIRKNDPADIYLENLQGSSSAVFFSAIDAVDSPLFIVLNDEDEAGFFYQDLVAMKGEENVLFFPSGFSRDIKFGRIDEASQILRTEVIGRLNSHPEKLIVVTYPQALSVKVASRQAVEKNTFTLNVNMEVGMYDLECKLLDLGMMRTDYVYEPGQFSVRGSILDIFSYSLEYPVRIDFFGDTIDSIRTFDVETQLSREKRDSITISAQIQDMADSLQSFWTLLPDGTFLVMRNPQYVHDVVRNVYETGFMKQAEIERQAMAVEDQPQSVSLQKERLLYDGEDWEDNMHRYRKIYLSHQKDVTDGLKFSFKTKLQPQFHKSMDLMAKSLEDDRDKNYTIYILSTDKTQHERIADILKGMDKNIPFTPVTDTLHSGFVDDTLKICFYTDHQIFDRFHRYNLRSERARGGKTSLTLKELREFEMGDYVVHLDHGVGRFEGLVRVQEGATEQEMMKITYSGGDVVYVSIHQLAKVSKYRGQGADEPRLNRLGTGSWNNMKERTKKRIKDIARDLIKLYSERSKQKGFAFTRDSYLQHELEASFEYEDTVDQVRVTQEVKHDMESDKPMDRLICGDVGFGKTEIAIRAAYKAAVDGKQVAVLVPTTVLAYQHYKTFSSRLKDFAVTVAYLTRAQSTAKVNEIREGLSSGKIDIVIGTQKILAKNIAFKDLGLLIVDEEQKFGVATKERLRQMRVNIDTLAMSATPIPRTLQFSLMGARDMSVLHTPPANRQPIHTEIHLFGHEIIADAIGYEMSRGGQVFVVCNRIASLPGLRDLIVKHVPNVRVGVGHGQMKPADLEKVVFDFINHDYDVLLSTTIIENGIDIPNANTIIIVDAQRYGLSDLHQMRGRVGRSSRKAFCYLLAPPFANLNTEARRRLEAIENFNELGSGLQIAMQDLDIRGAGNLLGAEQSGFIADLGYETYQKVLSEAVAELKNDEFSEFYVAAKEKENQLSGEVFVSECNLESDLPLFFPESFIPGNSERIDCYRRLNTLTDDEQMATFRQQLEDRFGKLPQEAVDLLKVNGLRRLGCKLGVERMLLKRGQMMLYFVANRNSAYYQSATFGKVLTYMTRNPMRGKVEEVNNHLRMILRNVTTIDEAISILTQITTQQQEISF